MRSHPGFTIQHRLRGLLDSILMALGTRPSHPMPAAPVARPRLRENPNSLRILLVGEATVNQLGALRLLEKYKHAVGVAANGRKALEELERESYDLVLMDVQMPEMTGWEATHVIREMEKLMGGHILVVGMAAIESEQDLCLDSGMDLYLPKPIRTQELLAVVHELGNRHARSSRASRFPSSRVQT